MLVIVVNELWESRVRIPIKRMETSYLERHTVAARVKECSTTGGEATCLESLTFLWIVNFEYPTRLHSGSTLRHVNYSRELIRLGHRVFLAVRFEPQYEKESREW